MHHTVTIDNSSLTALNKFLERAYLNPLRATKLNFKTYVPEIRFKDYFEWPFNGKEGYPIRNYKDNKIEFKTETKDSIIVSYPDVEFPTGENYIITYKGIRDYAFYKNDIPLPQVFLGFNTPSGRSSGSGLGIYSTPSLKKAGDYGSIIYELKLGFKRYCYDFINFKISEKMLCFITNNFNKDNINNPSKAALILGSLIGAFKGKLKVGSKEEFIKMYGDEKEVNDLLDHINEDEYHIIETQFHKLINERNKYMRLLAEAYKLKDDTAKEIYNKKINKLDKELDPIEHDFKHMRELEYKRLNLDLIIGFRSIKEIEQRMPFEYISRTQKYFHISRVIYY